MTELAGCVIRDEQGQVLLIHRNTPRLTQWELPGGKVEKGETLEQGAMREVLEEAGLVVSVTKKIGSAGFRDNQVDWNYTWFEAEIIDNSKPIIKELYMFDDIRFWNIGALRTRTDISINIVNLLKVLKK